MERHDEEEDEEDKGDVIEDREGLTLSDDEVVYFCCCVHWRVVYAVL